MVLTVNTVDIQYQCTMCDVDTNVFQHNINLEYKFIGFNLNPVLNLISMCNFQNSCQTSSDSHSKRIKDPPDPRDIWNRGRTCARCARGTSIFVIKVGFSGKARTAQN